MPVWQYRWKNRLLTVRVWYDSALRGTVLSFLHDSPDSLELALNFYVNYRDHHGIIQGDPPEASCRVEEETGYLSIGGSLPLSVYRKDPCRSTGLWFGTSFIPGKENGDWPIGKTTSWRFRQEYPSIPDRRRGFSGRKPLLEETCPL